jgi:hypothetical protein
MALLTKYGFLDAPECRPSKRNYDHILTPLLFSVTVLHMQSNLDIHILNNSCMFTYSCNTKIHHLPFTLIQVF